MTMIQTAMPSTPAPEKVAQRPTAGAPPTLSPSEQRLRAVIEAVPVSIVACKPEGDVLAANQAALALVGIKRLEQLIGKDLKTRVAPDSREAFAAFVRRVCEGQAGTLEYELLGQDDVPRRVETRAVLLRRDGMAGTAFLAATWDVGDRKPSVNVAKETLEQQELLRTQCQALEESVIDAKASYERLSQEHQAIEASLREAQTQAQVSLREAQARHETLAGESAAEREALLATLREAEDREIAVRETLEAKTRELQERGAERDALEAKLRESEERSGQRDALEARMRDYQDRESAAHQALEATRRQFEEREAILTSQLAAEQDARLADIERIRREEQDARLAEVERVKHEYAVGLNERMAEIQQLERTVNDMRTSYEVMLVAARAERDELSGTIHGLERRYAHLVEERDVEREALENMARAERTRAEQLLSAQNELQTKLASLAHALRDATRGAEDLVAECESSRLLLPSETPELPSRPVQPTAVTVPTEIESEVDSPWAF